MGNWLDEDISGTRYGHSRKRVQGVSLGSSWTPPERTAWKYNRKDPQTHRVWSGLHSNQGSTVRVYRGEVPELLLKASLRRQKGWIASSQSANPFPVPHFSLYPSSYFQPQRQPSEWLRSRRARWGKTRNAADPPQPPGRGLQGLEGKWRSLTLNEAMFEWMKQINWSLFAERKTPLWLKTSGLFVTWECLGRLWDLLDFHPGTEKE